MASMTFLPGLALAMDDDLVLQRSGTGNLHQVFLGKSIVPTAIPGSQIIRVFLKRVRQLSAGQLLNIEIAVTVGVCLEFDLGKGLPRKSDRRATQKQFLHHWIFPGYVDTDQRTGESFIRAAPNARLTPTRALPHSAPAYSIDWTTAIHRSSGSYRTRDRPRHQPDAGSYDATGRITNVLAVDHSTGRFTGCDHEPGDQQR
jgi:hypothetical protein